MITEISATIELKFPDSRKIVFSMLSQSRVSVEDLPEEMRRLTAERIGVLDAEWHAKSRAPVAELDAANKTIVALRAELAAVRADNAKPAAPVEEPATIKQHRFRKHE